MQDLIINSGSDDPPSDYRFGLPAGREEWCLFDSWTSAAQLCAHDLGAGHHRFELAEGNVARQVFHAAIGRDDEVFGSSLL